MVGVNNSGKSSLLNFLYEFRHLFKMLSYPNGNLINAISGYQQDFSRASSILDNEEVFCNTNKRDLEIQFKFIDAENDPLIPKRIDIIVPRGKFSWLTKIILNDGQLNTEKGISFSDTILLSEGTPRVELSHFFKICKDFAEIHYIGPFRNAINIGSNQDYYDIQVGQAFIREWRNLKTGNIRKYNEAAYKLTEDIKHIFGFTDLEINPSDDDQTLQVFINGKSYKLSELGSGITQFIVVLVNAVKKQPSYKFIDEPELNLHPSLQLDFLTTLGSYSKEGVLFATHSIGLARASADWIYSVNKINHEESMLTEFEGTPHLSEFLGELSFSGCKNLGFDQILLVEGTTDVKTIQQFLRLYGKDHQIVLLPLGGKSLINSSSEAELIEIMRISKNVCALIDSERNGPEDSLERNRHEFVEICKKVGIKCHVLNRRATENYFTNEAIKNVYGNNYQALDPYQQIKEISP